MDPRPQEIIPYVFPQVFPRSKWKQRASDASYRRVTVTDREVTQHGPIDRIP